nr:He2 protein [Danio rerio]BAD15104.1 high choriolytic enzyme [Danio rerio]
MDPKISLSIQLLLVGISLAAPVGEYDNSNGIETPQNVDITTLLETNKGSSRRLIEGDMLYPQTRNALVCGNNNCFWKKNSSNFVEVPYIVSSEYSATEISVIQKAMSGIHNKTCIRFVPRISQTDYISIENQDGCFAFIGKKGGKQLVSLRKKGCVYHSIVQHELNHALGFYHEHVRSDRDSYITIHWEYIATNEIRNFMKKNTNSQNTTYDYGSIMHYGKTAFTTVKGKETMTPYPDETVPIGKAKEMSDIDILRINMMYSCNISDDLKI